MLSFLWHETTLLFFQSSGKTRSFSIDWKIRLNGRAMDLPQSLIIWTDVLSHPYALSLFRFFIIRFISTSVKVIFSILLPVLNSKAGSWLLLVTGVHLYPVPLIQIFFRKLKLKLQNVYKADEFVLYLSKQCINSKNEEKNWYGMIQGTIKTFLAFPVQQISSWLKLPRYQANISNNFLPGSLNLIITLYLCVFPTAKFLILHMAHIKRWSK